MGFFRDLLNRSGRPRRAYTQRRQSSSNPLRRGSTQSRRFTQSRRNTSQSIVYANTLGDPRNPRYYSRNSVSSNRSRRSSYFSSRWPYRRASSRSYRFRRRTSSYAPSRTSSYHAPSRSSSYYAPSRTSSYYASPRTDSYGRLPPRRARSHRDSSRRHRTRSSSAAVYPTYQEPHPVYYAQSSAQPQWQHSRYNSGSMPSTAAHGHRHSGHRHNEPSYTSHYTSSPTASSIDLRFTASQQQPPRSTNVKRATQHVARTNHRAFPRKSSFATGRRKSQGLSVSWAPSQDWDTFTIPSRADMNANRW
ncbi:hypothetical protein K474DRAFT_56098 [Panus rudis PR-1116 ss-1]|nr:hypothetical protein K474DRAFT_56098 [Panus rudis PR-1116 ss-1]